MASLDRKHQLLTALLLSLLPLVLFTASLAPPLVDDASANGKPTPTATASPVPTATPTPPPAPTASNQVFEVAVTYSTTGLSNPWEDVAVIATFTAPSGAVATVHGFYYDVDTYKVRFAPRESGPYTYTITVQGPSPSAPISGSFTPVPATNTAFLKLLPGNTNRLANADGSLFNGIGINDCWPGPPGAEGGDISVNNFVDLPTYFSTYGQAGFNMLRWNPGNCSFNLYQSISTTSNVYLVPEGKYGDDLIDTARANGFHIMFTFFYQPVFADAATNTAEQAALRRYFDYISSRYGAYVDIWELNNESSTRSVPNAWMTWAVPALRSVDPYGHLVTNSYPRTNDWAYLDIRSPHWYTTENELASDSATNSELNSYKVAGHPVVIGEQGNATCNWDDGSALRMRIRSWAAFFDEGYLIFWNSSFSQSYCAKAANLYIGPQERGYIGVLQQFTANVDPTVRMMTLSSSNSGVRAYGLQSSTTLLGYFQHSANHTSPATTSITADLPFSGTATWIDPATGNVLQTAPVASGVSTLTTPPFVVDLALRVSAS